PDPVGAGAARGRAPGRAELRAPRRGPAAAGAQEARMSSAAQDGRDSGAPRSGDPGTHEHRSANTSSDGVHGSRGLPRTTIRGSGSGTTARYMDLVLLLLILLAAWHTLYAAVGDVALTPPLATLRNAGALLTPAVFLRHLAATADAFAVSLVITAVGGGAAGLGPGFYRLSGLVCGPVPAPASPLPHG